MLKLIRDGSTLNKFNDTPGSMDKGGWNLPTRHSDYFFQAPHHMTRNPISPRFRTVVMTTLLKKKWLEPFLNCR